MFLALEGFGLFIVALIAFIIILTAIISIHEAGHLFFAKKANILCHEYSIGMGPCLYRKKNKETDFCIRAIPIGGFVSMAGEDINDQLLKTGDKIGLNVNADNRVTEIILDEKAESQFVGEVVTSDLYGQSGEVLYITINDGAQEKYFEVERNARYIFEKKKELQITPYDRSFESKKWLPRFLTIFAGPFMNFVLAMFIYIIVAFATGVPNTNSNRIGEVSADGAAYGILQAGDEIVGVNGASVSSWNEFSEAINKVYENYETTIYVTYIRDNQAPVTEAIEATTYITSIGISNIQATKDPLPTGIDGLRVGALGVRYLDKNNQGAYPLATNDILTKVRIDTYDYSSKSFVEGEVIELHSNDWGKLSKLFNEAELANVVFEYYSVKNERLVTIGECATMQTYTNEVLENQRIPKISNKIGISAEYHFDFFGCLGSACQSFWNDFTLIFRTLKLLIAPSEFRQIGVGELSSVIGIFSMVETYVTAGILSLLSFAALISVNIGVMNLLPIPALDGGRILFLIIEGITRKKIPKKVENTINNIFFILLMILFVYISINDIIRLF